MIDKYSPGYIYRYMFVQSFRYCVVRQVCEAIKTALLDSFTLSIFMCDD